MEKIKDMIPSEAVIKEFKAILESNFTGAVVYVGGSYDMRGNPIILWELRFSKEHVRAGKIRIDKLERYDVINAEKRAFELVNHIKENS